MKLVQPPVVREPDGGGPAPLLVFLHGIGEGYVDKGHTGKDNLTKHGPPKHAEMLSAGHPLRAFKLLSPQLPDRDTPWTAVVDEIEALVKQHANGQKVYVAGFSKGGLGTLQVAKQLGAAAAFTMDAAPMSPNPKQAAVVAHAAIKDIPFWAIHTEYEAKERHRPIQDFNESLMANIHPNLASVPQKGAAWRTLVPAPAGMTPEDRHAWMAERATTSAAPYQWLLQH
jgi:predicted peptidase